MAQRWLTEPSWMPGDPAGSEQYGHGQHSDLHPCQWQWQRPLQAQHASNHMRWLSSCACP